MSQKTEKPTLSGQRIKTRKRDEREKFDPHGFRDSIFQGLNEAGTDLDAVSKYLDSAGSKLDYRRYGESLFDILIAGGLLAPGGEIIQDVDRNKPSKTNVCVFGTEDDGMENMRGFEQVFLKLMRRYKYLEKMFVEEMRKVLVYLRGFNESERIRLARMTALWLANGAIPTIVLLVIINEHIVKDGIALEFITEVFVTWKQERGITSVMTALKKSGVDIRLMEFFPPNKRTTEYFHKTFEEKGLSEIIRFQKQQANQEVKRDLQKQLEEQIHDGKSVKDVIADLKETVNRYELQDHEIIGIIWTTVMGAMEWNKKEELVAEQALKHLRQYTPLFEAYTQNAKSELTLLLKIQEFCYDNMNFMKVFQKVVLLFYKTDVLSEDAILKWYKEAHSVKGKSYFLDQMKKFVEWLQNAEEESESGEEED